VPARANGQLAFGNYRWDEKWHSFLPRSISVMTLDGEGIAAITTFLGPELVSSFGLPGEVPPGR
jgi:RNA polymerase sigma-70 factor (ECF subfamily)